MNKNDISDAMDFLDEDMVRHTEMLRRNWAQQEEKRGLRRKWRSFGAAAVACLALFFILIALVVWINRKASAGQGEGGASVTEGMTAKEDGQSETEDMTVYNSEAEVSEASEEFVTIETLLKQLEQEEGAFTESGTLDTILSKVEIGDYVGLYELVFWSQSGDGVLSESMGSRVTEGEDLAEGTGIEAAGSASLEESTGTELPDGYYRIAGHEDLQYLIYKETYTENSGEDTYAAYIEDGEPNETNYYFLMKFVCFDSEEYAYSDVLSLVYQISSAEDIAQILVKSSRADNTDAGKLLQEQIGESTVTDEDDIEAFYEILSSITCYGSNRWDLIDLGDWDIPADSSVNDNPQTYSRIWFERYLTVTTDYGNEIDGLKYTAYSDMFYEFGGIAYTPLHKEQAEKICEILGIEADETETEDDIGDTDMETDVSVDEDNLP